MLLLCSLLWLLSTKAFVSIADTGMVIEMIVIKKPPPTEEI